MMTKRNKISRSFLMRTAAAVLFGCFLALSGGEAAFSGGQALAQASQGFPDKRMQDFQRRRACEQNLPTCLPQVRRQIEQERSNQMWMGGMIVGVLVLMGLMVVRANKAREIEKQQMLAKGRQAARLRKQARRKKSGGIEDDEFDDDDDGLATRSTLERPPSFGKRRD